MSIRKTLKSRMLAGGVMLALLFSITACPQAEEALKQAGFIAVDADYGDAPDNRDDANGERFPTKAENNGARHLDTTMSALGHFLDDGSLPVSSEVGATDPNDPDGQPNLDPDNKDAFDDGFLVGAIPASASFQLPVAVSVAAGATDQLRYINILADWNQDLEWSGTTSGGAEEWVVKNFPVHVVPGTSENFLTPAALMGAQMHNLWYRVTLSENPIDESAYPNGWDGTGEFAEGETEDYYFPSIPLAEIELDDTVFPPIPPYYPPEDPLEDPDNPGDPSDLVDPNGPEEEQCPVDPDDPDADDPDNPDPDGDGEPGINKKNIGKLKKIGPNTYKLVICKGKTWYRGFKWETWLRNGRNSNPFTMGVQMTNDPGTISIRGRDVGTSTLTFEARTSTFPVSNNNWVTGTIHVTVIDCEPKCDAEKKDHAGDPDKDAPVAGPADPFGGIDNAGVEDLYKLRDAGDNVFYIVICVCDEDMSFERGFQHATNVRNPQTGDSDVADISLQNDPGRIRITPNGVGTTTVTFEADVQTFPQDQVQYETITVHVKVIECPEDMAFMN